MSDKTNDELLQELCDTAQDLGNYKWPRTDAEGNMVVRLLTLRTEILQRMALPEATNLRSVAEEIAKGFPGTDADHERWEAWIYSVFHSHRMVT